MSRKLFDAEPHIKVMKKAYSQIRVVSRHWSAAGAVAQAGVVRARAKLDHPNKPALVWIEGNETATLLKPSSSPAVRNQLANRGTR